ncbi:PadR family transcriptional regulator, regulatory protein PadR [Anaerosphaera aminiphila DSM 21120]|uniref:PadR family transcriptional regulator, regulatory protein PadR n=1 Tax=Anaerosphaera aminiphila DSM 21120 TaxID=1120995 RepID=A0A1M5PER4_9FIRM|nr:PadR family transcriptional regulator [Anaerosphaera aminiphila]SHH00262.1 PadR family transcriptional regulator, regulatory protein PadR [Anaerosphaera aminiphila DSM 21120]
MFVLSSQVLDLCVLATVNKEDTYGYKLTQDLIEAISISESTLYPVLRRLQKDNCLTTYDQPFGGRNRRYYQITPEGRRQLKKYEQDWIGYKESIDKIIRGDLK